MTEQLTAQLPAVERRSAERFTPEEAGCYHLIATVGTDSRPAQVCDISIKGVRLRLDHPFLPGTVVPVNLSNTSQLFSRQVQFRVVHVMSQDDGTSIVGGEFSGELSHDELRKLLG